MVPQLAEAGITHAELKDGRLLSLKEFRVHAVLMHAPNYELFLELDYGTLRRREPMYATVGGPQPRFLSHNVLVCKSPEHEDLIDIAIGQYTGKMQPLHSASGFDGLALGYPSPAAGVRPNTDSEIKGQLKQDADLARDFARRNKHPLARSPERFAKRLVDELLKASSPWDGFCRSCLCAPNSKSAKLRLCSRCKGVSYCGVQCQKLHWKVHKADCRA